MWCMFLILYMRFYTKWGLQSNCLLCGLINHWVGIELFHDLQHHAKKLYDTFPMAAETILKATYMDDSMDSISSEEQGIELHRQFSLLLTKVVCMRRSGCSIPQRC